MQSRADEQERAGSTPALSLDADASMWAARYIIRGLNPIPLQPRSKQPARKWEQFQEAPLLERDTRKLDEYIVSWWPRHGLGLVTGRAFGLVVVDVDSSEARAVIEDACGGWPFAGEVATARGSHLYFNYPPGVKLSNRAHVGDVALDIRSDHGYVVAPPSIHPSGVPYQWTRWTDTPFPPMPPGLLELLQPRTLRGRQHLRAVRPEVRRSRYVTAALEAETRTVQQAAVGSRNDALNTATFALARFVIAGELGAAEVAEVLVQAATAAGLPEVEARRTVASALNARCAS